ncbi:hypothetical protein LCGC14_0342410 [marine sediment metagenome]|uniref:Uncharacterized protein n=1 Tax=marine sediment metagenome TaxID=412755 RepID=A0A0F9TIY6_9ZZZZ
MTNTDKVYRSLNLSMREWTTDIFHGMSQYDEHTDLSRSQWSEAIQSNIRNGDIAGYDLGQKIGRALKLDKGMYFLIRKERYVDIKEEDLSNVDENDSIICSSPELPIYLKIIGFPEYGFESFNDIKIFLKIIPESEYQNQIAAKKLNEEFPPEKPNVIYGKNKQTTDDFPETDCELIFPFKPTNVIYGKNKQTTDDFPETDCELIVPFKPTKSFKTKIKVLDIKENTELKAGDYVRIKQNIEELCQTSGVYYNPLMKRIKIGIHKVNDIEVGKFYSETAINISNKQWDVPISAIKKIIKLPEQFKIDAGEQGKDVLNELIQLGYELVGYPYKKFEHIFVDKKTYQTKPGGDKLFFSKQEYPELNLAEFYTEVGLEMPAITKEGKLAGEPKYTDEEREEMEMLYCESKKMKLNISDAKELLNKYHNFKTYVHGVDDIYSSDDEFTATDVEKEIECHPTAVPGKVTLKVARYIDELTDDEMQEAIYGKSGTKMADKHPRLVEKMQADGYLHEDLKKCATETAKRVLESRIERLPDRLDYLTSAIRNKLDRREVIKFSWIDDRNLIIEELNQLTGEK